jgi:hypothetical protein
MATSEISICNLAISWVGGTKITSFSDNTDESKLCEAVYAADRDAVLEERNWSFATKRAKLNRLAVDPVFGFSSSFQLPIDHIRTVSLATDQSFNNTVKDWVLEGDQILVNSDVAYLKYVVQCSDPVRFSPGFVQCLAARIAADISIPLTTNVDLSTYYRNMYKDFLETGGNMDGLQGRAQQLYATKLTRVR